MMDVYTLDFETYYDQEYTLSKMTTEAYVRDPRFETIGLGIKKNDMKTGYTNDPALIRHQLSHIDFSDSAILAHNTTFDGAILSWLYNVKPKLWLDTTCMARALHGVDQSAALGALSKRYGIGEKGSEVLAAKGKRAADFTEEEARKYGEYCIQDVDLTHKLFKIMGATFPRQELKLIDATLRMFIEPVLDLDLGLLEQHLEDTRERKYELMRIAGVTDRSALMSSKKFATMLRARGVEPPMKISPTTGKETYAFAKTDQGLNALQDHSDGRVRSLVAARLGNKSTLEDTRTERFIGIHGRGLLPGPIRYYAAHTGRWGGSDKINLQNLPSRGQNANKLKKAIIAPEGYSIVEADSSQIEARVLAWFAGQDDLTAAFTRGEDVYVKMAARIYNLAEADITKPQRFVGKSTILGAGYGMGAAEFQRQLKLFGYEVSLEEAQRIITIYRESNPKISDVWREADDMVKHLAKGRAMAFGKRGVVSVDAANSAIIVPSGLSIFYPDLCGGWSDGRFEYSYERRTGRTNIYGGKVIENVCQAIARCIIGEQILRINKKYKVVLTVHDSILCCVPDDDVRETRAFVEANMRWTPDWAEGLPISCESGSGKSYGECE